MNDPLFEKLAASKKYRDVCPDAIARILTECRAKYRKEKEIDKAVRERLHGITSAFMTDAEYHRALRIAADGGDIEELMRCHASTRERLPLPAADALYDRLFDGASPASALDLACGLNPAYLRSRYPNMRVTGIDISGQCVRVLQTMGIDARSGDLLSDGAVPRERYEFALLFKILPLLERQAAGSAARIMESVNAETLICSFPTRSLSGRNVGMAENYAAWMAGHLPENRTIVRTVETDNELYYILKEKSNGEAVCGCDPDRKSERSDAADARGD